MHYNLKASESYSGVIVPMVTPFNRDLTIDEQSTRILIDHLLSHHVIPFILGTTGEGASVTEKHKTEFVRLVGRFIRDKSIFLAGISGNSLLAAIENAKTYSDLGANAVVSTLPYYFPMETDRMEQYFSELADNSPLPLIIYNMPATTGMSIPLEIIERLSYHTNIAGVKDSERDVPRLDRSLNLWSGRNDFKFLLGWAAQSVYGLTHGASGLVPSTANLNPGLYTKMINSVRSGNTEAAEELQKRSDLLGGIYQKDRKLNRSLPVLKLMLSWKGLCQPFVLPPLYRMQEGEEKDFTIQYKEEIDSLDLT